MTPWMKCAGLVGVLVGTLFLYAAGAAAFSYQAAEDLPFRVSLEDLKLAKMPATPQFFMKSLGGEFYPVTVLEAKAGENSILCKVQQKVPPGSYALFFQKKDRLFRLRKTLRILAPVIQQITIDHSKVADGNMVVLDGLYFGRHPSVTIEYPLTDQGPTAVKVCPSGDNAVTNSREGISSLKVEIPSLESAMPKTAVFTVTSKHGTASITFDENRLEGGTDNRRGTYVSHSLHSVVKKDEVWDYLVNSMVSGWFERLYAEYLLGLTKFWKQRSLYQYDLVLYNMLYWTVDAFGNPVQASGVVMVPVGKESVPLLSFQHGTMLTKKEAPTLSDSAELGFAVTFATTDGFVISMMDHQGMGQAAQNPRDRDKRRQLQPYCQGDTLAKGAADMMLALKQFMAKAHPTIKMDGKLYLTGYSEGAYATLALQRELETNTYEGLPALAVAGCGDGPYSLAKVMTNKLLEPRKYPVPYFAPLTLVTMNKTYFPELSTSDYMRYPYDVTVGEMINGYFSNDAVNQFMPTSGILSELLLDEVVKQMKAGTGVIAEAFKINDLAGGNDLLGYQWLPRNPVRLYHGETDDCVPYQNSVEAEQYYRSLGVPESIVKLVKVDSNRLPLIKPVTLHVLYAPFAVGDIWSWFHSLLAK